MNRIIRIALVFLGFFVLEQAASAQSNCKEARGNTVETFDGISTARGTLSNAGWLDGTIVAVSYGTANSTPDPSEVTFASTFTLTTNHGQLKGIRIYLFDFVRNQSTVMMKVDPAASTGIFAGATGVLFNNQIESAVNTFYTVVAGQICFAR